MDPRIWLLIAAVNLATFVLYGFDKWRARRRRRRVPEAWLLGSAFACGPVGAWIAVSTFHHKTRKVGFRVRLVLVSLFNPLWYLVWLQVR